MSDTSDLFADQAPLTGTRTPLGPQAVVLRGWALPQAPALWSALQAVVAQAPFRHMLTPGGQSMSVPLTNCGALGWTSSRAGYRYRPDDPDSAQPWPAPQAAAADPLCKKRWKPEVSKTARPGKAVNPTPKPRRSSATDVIWVLMD